MGIIKAETPDGIKKIEIAGDTPTAEEKNAIINTFSPKTKKIDKIWTNPYTGWLYEYKAEGWICIKDRIEQCVD